MGLLKEEKKKKGGKGEELSRDQERKGEEKTFSFLNVLLASMLPSGKGGKGRRGVTTKTTEKGLLTPKRSGQVLFPLREREKGEGRNAEE